MRSRILVAGVVQGVGFRPFVYRIAVSNDLKGYARNMGNGTLEIEVEGKKKDLDRFVRELQSKKPLLSQIDTLHKDDFEDGLGYTSFRILQSEHKENESASLIPPDISICSDCAQELSNISNRRYGYHFITCTNCGPRFTIIEKFPYDRKNTTMKDFALCRTCQREYRDSSDRRFHAETIACGVCGPSLKLFDTKGNIIPGDPISEAAKLIDEGRILAIKGVGGFHIALSAFNDKSILQLRGWKHREQKPFAIMVKNIETARKIAYINHKEELMLLSTAKPILLLKLKKDTGLSELVSPKLHNIGIMLPYSGLHLLLFNKSETNIYIMTSGNLPSEPIVIDEKEAFKKFSELVDYFLIHNRKIAHRCDDSVLREVDGVFSFVRRSRGYTPQPLQLRDIKDVIGLGAEQNVNGCVISSEKAYLTQYIGDVENTETLDYLEAAVNRIIRLTACKPNAIAHDLHPTFNTTNLAEELSEELGIPSFPVQHHHAHIASVMAENDLESTMGIALDGYGYGVEGNAWGGEILFCERDHFKRVGHIEEQPYLGGDLAAKYPARMAYAILSKVGLGKEWAMSNLSKFPYRLEEMKILSEELKRKHYISTSSCGRMLDAIAALLDICDTRTYEGEPAMKLESVAIGASKKYSVRPIIKSDILMTTPLLEDLYYEIGKTSRKELAYAGEEYLARGIAELAIQEAEEYGIKNISFSGGVAYNEHISNRIRTIIESNNLIFHRKKYAPPGDGCISLGQAFVVGKWKLR